jgi:polyvinyl alcohol dehydrogenase (cytochrome)
MNAGPVNDRGIRIDTIHKTAKGIRTRVLTEMIRAREGRRVRCSMLAQISTLILLLLVSAHRAASAQDGAFLFQVNCSSCHRSGGQAQAPLPDALRRMSWQAILEALETGKMQSQGAFLSAAERNAIAKYLGLADIPEVIPASARCSESPKVRRMEPAWIGWGADSSNSRFQPSRTAGLTRESVQKLKLRWAFGFPGATTARAQVTVYGGQVFVGSSDGTVYSLDARSGCIHWLYKAPEEVRTAVIIGNNGRAAYFGDLQGHMYAVNPTTGALLWKTRVDDHRYAAISGTPQLHGGKIYVPVSGGLEEVAAGNPLFECCTFRGSVVALNADDGKLLWKTYTIPGPAHATGRNAAGAQTWGPAGAGVWSSPTLDLGRRAVYVATGVNYSDPATESSDAVLAFDMDSGRLLWSRQFLANDRFNFGCVATNQANCPHEPGPNFDIGASPILRTLPGGRRVLLVGQKSGVVHALDPDRRGSIVWETRISPGAVMGGIMWGGANDDRGSVYFPISDWDPTTPEVGGGVVALQIASGEKLWSTSAPPPRCLTVPGCSAAQPGPATVIPGVVFVGSLDGHLRAYDAANGRVIWDFDTLHEFRAADGVKARGGSLNAAGPVVVGGMVYANSGYAVIPAIAGNVLLAFSVDGK